MTMNRREIILQEIQIEPNNPLNYYLLALEDRREENLDSCIITLQELIVRFPNFHPSYYILAEIFYQLDRTDEGTAIANQGIVIAKDLQLMKVLHELEQLILLND